MMSASQGATSFTKPKSRSGGLEQAAWPALPSRGCRPAALSEKRRELAMTSFQFDDLAQYSDTLRARSGEAVTVRFVEPRDAEELQSYYRSLSARSRYNRFLGAMSELPKSVLDHFTHVGRDDSFTVVATMMIDGFEAIVGEGRYAFHAEDSSIEFGMSIDDRWQGHGIGAALMKNLECRAASFGAGNMFGDTLRSNDSMIALARKSGYAFTNHPDDWKLVRFEKEIATAPKDIPCASWRLAAQARQLAAVA
jgi:GNAT superfamily N-acetyltransferase